MDDDQDYVMVSSPRSKKARKAAKELMESARKEAKHFRLNDSRKSKAKPHEDAFACFLLFLSIMIIMGSLLFNEPAKGNSVEDTIVEANRPNNSSEQYYSLEPTGDYYSLPVITKEYGFEYYVRLVDTFDKKYPVGSSARAEVENDVIEHNVKTLQTYCYQELLYNRALGLPENPARACDKLESMDWQFGHLDYWTLYKVR